VRIPLVHSFYRSEDPRGENDVVPRRVGALQDSRNEVLLVERHTDDGSRRWLDGLRTAVRVGAGTGPDPTGEQKVIGSVASILFPSFGKRWLGRWTGFAGRRCPVHSPLHLRQRSAVPRSRNLPALRRRRHATRNQAPLLPGSSTSHGAAGGAQRRRGATQPARPVRAPSPSCGAAPRTRCTQACTRRWGWSSQVAG
jgi:hypothetical protein